MLKNVILLIIRWFVGGLFIFSGLIKINDPVGTAIKLEEYFEVFSSDIASFFHLFKEFTLPIGVFLVVLEVVLGVMLILNVKIRFTVWALGILIFFFTFLTFYSAYFNKVTDCGCFGDAIKLTPWESFYKDIVLLVLIAVLFVFIPDLKENNNKWAKISVALSLILGFTLAIYAIYNLPFIDFRAYKKGVNIPLAMQASAPLQYQYIMKKDGKEVILDQYISEEGYEFVEMKLVNEEALPKITDFAVWNSEGDFTDEILSGNKAVVLITNINKADPNNFSKIDELVKQLQGKAIEPVLMAANSEEEINQFLKMKNWEIKAYSGDATVIKTIMRSNPGLMLLKSGVVLDKFHYRNVPDLGAVVAYY